MDKEKTDKSLVDVVQVGYGEGALNLLIPHIEDWLVKSGKRGYECRKELFDYLAFDPETYKVMDRKLYFPYYYEYKNVNDSSVIIESITCTDDRLTPVGRVDVNRPTSGDFPIFDKKILNLDGNANRSVDVMISTGCSANSCSFCLVRDTVVSTDKGSVTIDQVSIGDIVVVPGGGYSTVLNSMFVGNKPVVKVSTEEGLSVEGTHDHRILSFEDDRAVWKEFGELKIGDYVATYSGHKLEEVSTNLGTKTGLIGTSIDYILEKGLFFQKVKSLVNEGVKEVFDITVDCAEHWFIANGLVVHNCSEGQLAGAWREKDLVDIEKAMIGLKESSAGNVCSFYSYNLNYYKQFLDMLKLGAKHFSNLSLINQRADVVASRDDYVRLGKALGVIRMSMAVEGIGERMRNNFLNKNLTKEVWFQAARNAFAQKLIMVKFGNDLLC